MEKMVDVSRYTDVTELQFEVEFITPCFLGGADGNAEIRTAPFKAGIRYWWRVLFGTKYLEKLRETENMIFGSTENKSMVNIIVVEQSAIKVEKGGFPKGRKIIVSHKGREMKVNILDYLAYGKYEYQKGNGNVYIVKSIQPGGKLKFSIQIKKSPYTDEIIDAIKMFFYYGGVGSKSRNGFGSMSCSIMDYPFSKNIKPLSLQEFPVISTSSKFFITKTSYNTWEDALSEIGIIYKNARGSLEQTHVFEQRGYVARPIEARFEKIPNNIRSGRIPKPFYLGLIKSKDKYYGYILSLPIIFYEKHNQQNYLQAINQMTKYFSEKMKDDTAMFLSEFTKEQK